MNALSLLTSYGLSKRAAKLAVMGITISLIAGPAFAHQNDCGGIG